MFNFELNLEEEIKNMKKEYHEKCSQDMKNQMGCIGELADTVITLSEEDEDFNKEVTHAVCDKIGEEFFKKLFDYLDNELKKYNNSYLTDQCFYSIWFVNLFVGAQRYVKKYSNPDDVNYMFEKMIEDLKRLIEEKGATE